MKNIYLFKPYNAIFPTLFEKEKNRLLTFLPKLYEIEHVGSTAIPNLGGKGVIDICIIVQHEDTQAVWDALEEAGYELRPNYRPDMNVSHTILLPDPVENERKYQIHIRSSDSQILKEMLAFRDYLRNHPEDTQRYAEVKQKATQEANGDRDIYLEMKSNVIKEITQKALSYHKNR